MDQKCGMCVEFTPYNDEPYNYGKCAQAGEESDPSTEDGSDCDSYGPVICDCGGELKHGHVCPDCGKVWGDNP